MISAKRTLLLRLKYLEITESKALYEYIFELNIFSKKSDFLSTTGIKKVKKSVYYSSYVNTIFYSFNVVLYYNECTR
jgi:hypothetical protein